MRILFLTDNFPPEVNAPANRTFEHCREWVRAGEKVTVITGAPNFPSGKIHPGYRNRLWQRECVEGIEVIRVWTYMTANEGFFKRTVDYVSYAVSAVLAGLFVKADVIIETSPQFFTATAGFVLGFLKRRPWIFEVRDIWPESIKAVGAARDSAVIRMLERLELLMYRHADHIVLVTESFKTKLEKRGVSPSKMTVVTNGVDESLFHPMQADTALASSLGLENRFVVSYIGTLGMAHGLRSMVSAAKAVPEPAHLLIIGDGAQRQDLERIAAEEESRNVTILPPVSHRSIPSYFSISSATLVHLKRSDTFKEVLPSKIFEAAAMQCPILLGVDGEARQLVERYNAGIFFEPENGDGFLEALRRMMEDSELYARLKEGCARLAHDFSRSALGLKMLECVRKTATGVSR